MLKNKYVRWGGIGCLGFLALGFILSLVSPEPALSQEDQLATAVSALQTENAPTAATVSTETAMPEPTETPLFSPDEQAYIIFTGTEFQAFSDAFVDFGSKNNEAVNNPLLLIGGDWPLEMGDILARLAQHAANLSGYALVPDRMSGLDQSYDALYTETLMMVANYSIGVDNADLEMIQRASENITNMGLIMETLNDQLIQFLPQ